MNMTVEIWIKYEETTEKAVVVVSQLDLGPNGAPEVTKACQKSVLMSSVS